MNGRAYADWPNPETAAAAEVAARSEDTQALVASLQDVDRDEALARLEKAVLRGFEAAIERTDPAQAAEARLRMPKIDWRVVSEHLLNQSRLRRHVVEMLAELRGRMPHSDRSSSRILLSIEPGHDGNSFRIVAELRGGGRCCPVCGTLIPEDAVWDGGVALVQAWGSEGSPAWGQDDGENPAMVMAVCPDCQAVVAPLGSRSEGVH